MARGDHIFVIVRPLGYSHHGIDCGEGRVIHFDSNVSRKLAAMVSIQRPPRIVEVSQEEFCQGREIRTRPYQECDPPEVVIARARSRLGHEGYRLFGNNCEHFAVWCKTARAESTQVQAFQQVGRSVHRATTAAVVAWRVARYLPPAMRPWAVATAMGITAGAGALDYWRCRRMSRARQES
jgi:hypothetical protein